jgi:hypothetical protein
VALFGLHVSLTPVALGSLTFQSGDVKLWSSPSEAPSRFCLDFFCRRFIVQTLPVGVSQCITASRFSTEFPFSDATQRDWWDESQLPRVLADANALWISECFSFIAFLVLSEEQGLFVRDMHAKVSTVDLTQPESTGVIHLITFNRFQDWQFTHTLDQCILSTHLSHSIFHWEGCPVHTFSKAEQTFRTIQVLQNLPSAQCVGCLSFCRTSDLHVSLRKSAGHVASLSWQWSFSSSHSNVPKSRMTVTSCHTWASDMICSPVAGLNVRWSGGSQRWARNLRDIWPLVSLTI